MEKIKLNYEEVIYTSSQKGILTGQPGFGCRTHTQNMNTNDIESLVGKDIFGYKLPADRMVSLSQLQSDPKIVYKYPTTFVYKKITTNNGSEKYVFSRTIYIGVDYGYFCNGTALRAGANYLTHVLIFDEMPPSAVFSSLIPQALNQPIFLPIDYTCTPDNKELNVLLTGEPKFLPIRDIAIQSENVTCNIDANIGEVIIGLLQLYILNVRGENNKHLIIKATDKETNRLARFIKVHMPNRYVDQLSFSTNYSRDGVSDDLDLVFVNEYYKGSLYEEDHICIDLLINSHTGLENNYIYNKIRELVENNKVETLMSLLQYLSSISHSDNIDYEFIYKLYILIKSNQIISIQDLNKSFIANIINANLCKNDIFIVWNKINRSVNEGLCSDQGQDIKTSILVINDITSLQGNHLEISKDAQLKLSAILFKTDKYFKKLVNISNLKTVIQILGKDGIASENQLFSSLKTIRDLKVWEELIKFYFHNNITKNFSNILTNILDASFSSQEKEELTISLFPMQRNLSNYYNYLINNIESVSTLPNILRKTCLDSNTECFSAFLMLASNKPMTTILSPIIIDYFTQKINNNVSSGMSELISMINNITPALFDKLNVSDLINQYVSIVYNNPISKLKDQIKSILEIGIAIPKEAQIKLNVLLDMYNNIIPQSVDYKIMIMAYELEKSEDYCESLFNLWVKNKIKIKELKEYILKADRLQRNPQMIEYMLITIWKSRVPAIREKKGKYILTIVDNVKWYKKDYKEFLKNCTDVKLVNFLIKSSSFFSKIFRKLFNF